MTTYWDYLKLDSLLALQTGLEIDDRELLAGELHFIIVHQVTELWFKLALEQLRLACAGLHDSDGRSDVPGIVGHLARVVKILQASTAQWDLVEALPVQEFLRIRDKVLPASGAQSFQIAAFEILLGLEEAMEVTPDQARSLEHLRRAATHSPGGPLAWGTIEQARGERTLRGALHQYLHRTPICGSCPDDADDDDVVDAFVTRYAEALAKYYEESWRSAHGPHRSEALDAKIEATVRSAKEFLFALDHPDIGRSVCKRRRAVLVMVDTYTEVPALFALRALIDHAMDLEQQFVIWRTRHIRTVERLIGNRIGTGGGSTSYLERSLSQRALADLWAARTVTVPRLFAPDLSIASLHSYEGSASC